MELKHESGEESFPMNSALTVNGNVEDILAGDTNTAVEETVSEGIEFRASDDENSRLAQLAATVRDQDELEQNIGRQADQMLLDQANERDQKRLEKTEAQKEKLVSQIRKLQESLSRSNTNGSLRARSEIQHLQPQVEALDRDLDQIRKRMSDRSAHEDDKSVDMPNEGSSNLRRVGETQREFLIRTGKITPFSKVGQNNVRNLSNLQEVMLDAEDRESDYEEEEEISSKESNHIESKPMSHRNLVKPGFSDLSIRKSDVYAEALGLRPRKKRKVHTETIHKPSKDTVTDEGSMSDFESGNNTQSGTESDDWITTGQNIKQVSSGKLNLSRNLIDQDPGSNDSIENLADVDDGNEALYQNRLASWVRRRKEARMKAQSDIGFQNETGAEILLEADLSETNGEQTLQLEEKEEWQMPHPTRADTVLEGGLRIPGDIYPALFDYQKTGVKWLWELYSQHVGGIIGDEMGLGKTIQVISFLAGLHHSEKLTKPVLVVTPATVMKQWVNEFHQWWPPLRVSILHTSGSGMLNVRREKQLEDDLEERTYADLKVKARPGGKAAQRILDRVCQDGHVLVTTYSGLQTYAEILLPTQWGYVVLDEGHKIRNPDTAITIYCKHLKTPNRVILSGTPMQNNLVELWSLFDFITPGRLGVLPNFRTHFEFPIKQGGYANASNLQVETAMKCAETLKDAISPYLLQRFKVDVAADLPKKSEQVLFCKLTKLQRKAYEEFLTSKETEAILGGKRHALYGIDIMRKICNHPDLVEHKKLSIKPGYNYGQDSKSGKMQVVKALVELWTSTGHKTLLFAQHRIMLDILEKLMRQLTNIRYRRMDGNTPIQERQRLVDEFNNNSDIHVFLLTTKVGGLGVNLVGADRVIIFDPDWNPSTDVQARERAWRLGQKREVMIYRLMTAGTIEEKIYHRQIFKSFLTNKILRDPKQRQTFQMKDLHDLFSLGDADSAETETGGLFKGTETKFKQERDETTSSGDTSHVKPTNANDPHELTNIIGVSHHTEYRETDDGHEASKLKAGTDGKEDTLRPGESRSDARILSGIFSKAGVSSAFEHEAIINGRSTVTGKIAADPHIIATEAKRVAAAAAKELRRAEESSKTTPEGVPTWTGTAGTAGRPEERPRAVTSSSVPRGGLGRGGPSSSSVLSNLASRQSQANSPNGNMGQEDERPRGKQLLKMIVDFFKVHGGTLVTQMLINHFSSTVGGTPERNAEFYALVKEVAVLQKREESPSGSGSDGRRPRGHIARGAGQRTRDGRGRWLLKKEYGGTA